MVKNRDQIYSTARSNVDKFTFDKKVAAVFADMISRSVPGYQQILHLLPSLVKHYHIKQANYYDLGCSLGAGMAAIANGLHDLPQSETAHNNVIGIDASAAMLEKAKPLLDKHSATHGINFDLSCADITETEIAQAAMVLMNFTLQFIPIDKREKLIERIFNGLHEGGVLIISEKIKFNDEATNQALIEVHHQFKADQGYSQLEISQKRDAIENVLLAETLDTHIARLRKSGFSIVTPWIQNLQFVSILAIK